MIILSIVLIFFQNEHGYLTKNLEYLDTAILFFFIVEYGIRFYIYSDFRKDYRTKGLAFSIRQKLVWMVKPSSMIDLLAKYTSLNIIRALSKINFHPLMRYKRMIKELSTFSETVGWLFILSVTYYSIFSLTSCLGCYARKNCDCIFWPIE